MSLQKNYRFNDLIALAIGAICFVAVINPAILNVNFVSWIPAGDNLTNYLGWVFYRNGPLTLPWGLNPVYGDFISSSIVYTDSIPILAMIFKIFRSHLSEDFQYFGLWYLICFILQAYYGNKIANTISTIKFQKFLITIIFVYSPAFLCTINVNPTLAAHFIILASIYLLIRSDQYNRLLYWFFILILSAGIQFYIFLPVACVWLANLFDERFLKKSLNRFEFWKELLVIICSLAIFLWFAGYFAILTNEISSSVSTMGPGGYGTDIWSLNLLSLFLSDYWSLFSNGLADYYGASNSFNYFGLGVILLFFLTLFFWKKNFSQIFFKRNLFILFVVFFLAIFSITNIVRFGNYELNIPIPDGIVSIASILRSSSRIFWIPNYLLLVYMLKVALREFSGAKGTLILAIIVTLQLVDTSRGWIQLRNTIGVPQLYPFHNAFKDKIWDCRFLQENFDRIIYVPAKDYDRFWEGIGSVAAKCKLATNHVLLNRPARAKISKFNQKFSIDLAQNRLDSRTIYIVDESFVMPVRMHMDPMRDSFSKIGEYFVFIPNAINCSECPQPSDKFQIEALRVKNIEINKKIHFGREDLGSNYLFGVGQFSSFGWGWSYPETWGAWSEGRRSIALIPMPLSGGANNLLLTLRAYNPKGISQVVGIRINGEYIGKYVLNKTDANVISIPLGVFGSVDFLSIDFDTPGAVSPSDFEENNSDTRKISIGLISAEFR